MLALMLMLTLMLTLTLTLAHSTLPSALTLARRRGGPQAPTSAHKRGPAPGGFQSRWRALPTPPSPRRTGAGRGMRATSMDR